MNGSCRPGGEAYAIEKVGGAVRSNLTAEPVDETESFKCQR